MHNKFWQQHCNVLRPKNLSPWLYLNQGSSVSVGERDDPYATPPGLELIFLCFERPCYDNFLKRYIFWYFTNSSKMHFYYGLALIFFHWLKWC
jgi:hypothetical protein